MAIEIDSEAPSTPEVHENILKGVRFAERFVSKNTEAIIIVNKNGRYAMMDMQKPGAYRVSPDELLNERWREALPRPAKPAKPDDKKPTGAVPGKPA